MNVLLDCFRHLFTNHSNFENLEQYKRTVELIEPAKLFSTFYSTTKKRWALLQNQKHIMLFITYQRLISTTCPTYWAKLSWKVLGSCS